MVNCGRGQEELETWGELLLCRSLEKSWNGVSCVYNKAFSIAGEVVSIGQLASLAQRPVASAGGSKPLTFQIQGNKLTLTGAQVRQLAVGQPRPLQSR